MAKLKSKAKKEKPAKQEQPAQQQPQFVPIQTEFEFRKLEVEHLIKYNLYLLTKAIVLNTVWGDAATPEEAIESVNHIMGELDLDLKASKKDD